MARFCNAGGDRLTADSSPVSSYPITLAIWAYLTTVDLTQNLFSLGVTGGNESFHLRANSINTISARVVDSAGTGTAAASAGDVAANTWFHAAGVFVSDTSRSVYLNGSDVDTSTGSRTVVPSNFNRIGVAIGFDSAGVTAAGRGHFAEAAVWAVALTADEINQLAAGYSPLLVRPQSLRFYAPLFGRGGASANEQDWAGGLTLTQNSSPTVVDHPRIIYPSSRQIRVPSAVAAAFKPAWARRSSQIIGGR
jgi:hypothetical protein